MKKIKERKSWEWRDVRQMCIDNDFYTCGDNDEYENLRQFINSHKPTKTNIYKAALDIVKHSDPERYHSEESYINSVMWYLCHDAVSMWLEIER